MNAEPEGRSIALAYGDDELSAILPSSVTVTTLDIKPVLALAEPERAIREALLKPIGLERGLFDRVTPGEIVAILVSDSFRETRADLMVPAIADGLVRAGINERDVFIVFSTGTHRPPTLEEQKDILGETTFARFEGRRYVHDPYDPSNHVYVGKTRRGTPVEINRRVHEADRIIVTGSVVFHYFGGFGGGRKSVVPGIASVNTIAHNHAMNLHPHEPRLDPSVRIGALAGNPVAEDMLEATHLTHVDCIVNTVLNRDNEIAGIFVGELEAAHEAACAYAREIFEVPIAEPADLVIAASPHTKNFVQTHKALFNAYQALKPGGRIVLLAPCREGLGDRQFTQWLERGDREAIIAGLREQSEINGQTALSTREKAPITRLVTELTESEVKLLGAQKCASLQEALDDAIVDLAGSGTENPTVCLMPSAAYTVPASGR